MPQIIVVILLILIILASGWLTYFYNIMTNKKAVAEDCHEQLKLFIYDKAVLISSSINKNSQHSKVENVMLSDISERISQYLDSELLIESSEIMNKLIDAIFVSQEYQAELASDEEFSELELQLRSLEEKLAEAVEVYNDAAKTYNKFIFKFPNNFAAMIVGVKDLHYHTYLNPFIKPSNK